MRAESAFLWLTVRIGVAGWNDWVKWVEGAGGKVASGPKPSTSLYMVCLPQIRVSTDASIRVNGVLGSN